MKLAGMKDKILMQQSAKFDSYNCKKQLVIALKSQLTVKYIAYRVFDSLCTECQRA